MLQLQGLDQINTLVDYLIHFNTLLNTAYYQQRDRVNKALFLPLLLPFVLQQPTLELIQRTWYDFP